MNLEKSPEIEQKSPDSTPVDIAVDSAAKSTTVEKKAAEALTTNPESTDQINKSATQAKTEIAAAANEAQKKNQANQFKTQEYIATLA